MNAKYNLLTKKQILVLLAVIVTILTLLSSFLIDYMQGRPFSYKDGSAEVRCLVFQKGFTLLLEHPMFGVGFGNFELIDLEGYNSITGTGGHDIGWVVFASTGFIGSLLIILIIYRTFRYLTLAIKSELVQNDTYLLKLTITLRCAFIGIVYTLFGDPLVLQRIFWIYIASSKFTQVEPLRRLSANQYFLILK